MRFLRLSPGAHRRILALSLGVLSVSPGGLAGAADATRDALADAIPDGARLAATCTGCHGTNGLTIGDALPRLAGQSRDSLLTSLKAFKSGERPATVMTQLTKGYSDEQLERLADFFSAQRVSEPARGSSLAAPGPVGRHTLAEPQKSGDGS